MSQTTREREHTSSGEGEEDLVEVWVNIHQTDIPVPIMVKRGATVIDIISAIEAYYVSIGGVFNYRGSQILINDVQFVIDKEGTIEGNLAYAIYASATFTLTRQVTGGIL